MKIKCAIFDFDGTLYDSMFIWDTAGETYLRSLGKEPAPSMQKDVQTMSLFQSAEYFKSKYGLPLAIEEIIAGINQTIERYYVCEVLPKPGITGLLEEMKKAGISMCIATATDRYLVEAALKRCALNQYFDAVFTCSEVGCGKDKPVIFRRAMEYFEAERSNTVIFEDALHAARTAKADHFKVVAVYDASERKQTELRRISDCYLEDFKNTEIFWSFASAI